MTKRIESSLSELCRALDEKYGLRDFDSDLTLQLDINEYDITKMQDSGRRVLHNVFLNVRKTNKIGGSVEL